MKELKPWDPAVAGVQEFPITTYQPIYFVAESLNDAKSKMRSFCEGLKKVKPLRFLEVIENCYH